MKKILAVFALGAALLLAGCVVTSVYPFYTARDVAFDPGLVGVWTNGDNSGTSWTFQSSDTNAYNLTIVSSPDTNAMAACRFVLDGNVFLDVVTTDDTSKTQPWPIPSHLLLRLAKTNDLLKLSSMDYDWLAQAVSNNPAIVRHHVCGNPKDGQRLILTADTADLQKFVRSTLDNTNAWREAVELKRAGPGK
jgi:hypothetical protein